MSLFELWNQLKEYLSVTIEVHADESKNLEHPVTIQFVVTNKAGNMPTEPEIVFEEVRLKVGVPPDWHLEKALNLGSRQSFTYQHRCSYRDLTEIQYSVEGTVSPQYFFQVRNNAQPIPRGSPNLSALAYIKVLNGLEIHRWLQGVLKTVAIPGPSTTLAEIKTQAETLSKAIVEIHDAERRLQELFYFVNEQYRTKVAEYRNLVQEYLKRMVEGCARLQQALDRPDSREIAGVRNHIYTELAQQASRVNQATENLMKQYSFSDEDASYIYRDWQL